ncbi:hypothetical protein ADUPG1_000436 [Aduncisulcus paluster]|uniref:Uncharacterized protein n=1 Tax=Aduncisulcus paluster TaxID=2918883 RepID=A0ABQ5K6C1_9EUKA|nr:hypothetical protein ADUPG1_000436 [Aduncisulcus paluster]
MHQDETSELWIEVSIFPLSLLLLYAARVQEGNNGTKRTYESHMARLEGVEAMSFGAKLPPAMPKIPFPSSFDIFAHQPYDTLHTILKRQGEKTILTINTLFAQLHKGTDLEFLQKMVKPILLHMPPISQFKSFRGFDYDRVLFNLPLMVMMFVEKHGEKEESKMIRDVAIAACTMCYIGTQDTTRDEIMV